MRAALFLTLVSLGCDAAPGALPVVPAPAAPSADAAPDVTTVRCDTMIDAVDDPPPSYTVMAGAVALPKKHQAYLHGEGTFFAKAGLLVRARATVELAVAPPAAIKWGSPREPVARLRVQGCSREAATWVVFAGGFVVPKAMCTTLTVTSGGKSERVDIAVGADCPVAGAP